MKDNTLPFPKPGPEPKQDPVKARIVKAIAEYVSSLGPMSEENQQLAIASYMSGMAMAAHWTTMRPGVHVLMPGALHVAIGEMAHDMGMTDAREAKPD